MRGPGMLPARRAALIGACVASMTIGAGLLLFDGQAVADAPQQSAPQAASSPTGCQANVMVGRPSLDPSLDKPSAPSCDKQKAASDAPQKQNHRSRCGWDRRGQRLRWLGYVVFWFSLGVPALLILLARDRQRRRQARKHGCHAHACHSRRRSGDGGGPPFQM